MTRSTLPHISHEPYPASAYDPYLCLKPSPILWAILAFLLRPFVIFVASITNKADRTGLLHTVYADAHWALIQAGAALPAALVAIAYMRRTPEAGQFVRWCWKHGRTLILSSVLLNIITIAWPVVAASKLHLTGIATTEIGLCVLAAYYLIRSRRVKDAFADFPSSPVSSTKD